MSKVSDLPLVGRLVGMFIGASGSGKTVAACSFEDPYDLDIDIRIEGLLGAKKFVNLENVEYKRFTIGKGFKEVEDELNMIDVLIQMKQWTRKTFILDSLTNELRLFLADAMTLVGEDKETRKKGPIIKGRILGSLTLPGPAHYGYEAEATYQVFDFLRSWPVNIIVTAHEVDRYGKLDPSKEYSESVVIGKKLSVRDKIGANVLTYFNEIYEFSKEDYGNHIQHYVKFRGDLARTCYPQLPDGRVDITGKNFYELWKGLIEEKKGE